MSHGADVALTAPPQDAFGRLVWRMDRLLRWPEDALNLIAAGAIMFLMLMGVVQIVVSARVLFNAPIFGYIDATELAMPILAILGIAYCQRQGVHIRMDILMQRFDGRVLWVIETFAALATATIMIFLTYFAFNFFWDAYTIGDSTTDAEIDTWPSKLLVPFAFSLMVMRTLVQALGGFRLAMDPSLPPVGVVVQKDIAEQAQDEIREATVGEDAGEAR